MTTPCLTRQNAFLLEENEKHTPLDLVCGICNEAADDINSFIQPCLCKVRSRPYLAHGICFKKWSIDNGCPTYCTTCKAKYKTRRYNTRLIWIITILLTTFFFSVYQIIHCTELKTLTREEIIREHGENTFIDVPNEITLPILSVNCLTSSALTIPSILSLFSITIICFIFSFFTVNAFTTT